MSRGGRKIQCVLSEIYKTEFTSPRDFVRVLIAWRLWVAYDRKSNLENAMTLGIEFFVFLQPPCLDLGLRDYGTLRGPTAQEIKIATLHLNALDASALDPGNYLPGHTTLDFSLGKSFAEKYSVSVTALNVTNRRVLLDNSVTFGGFHYNDPRQIYVELRYRFHY